MIGSITVAGVEDLRKQFKQFSDRRFAAAVATALTRTAASGRQVVQQAAAASFDRPTPYTLRQIRFVSASAQKLVSAVGFNVAAIQDEFGRVIRFADLGPGNTPAGEYLPPNVTGGTRRLKRMEVALQAAGLLPPGWFAVPGQGARIDAYGNVSKGQVIEVLSQLRLQMVAGSSRNISTQARSAIRAQRRAGGRYFAVPVGDTTGRQPGVYQREFVGRNITPVFVFVRGVNYKPRFPFERIVQGHVAARLPVEMDRALREHIARVAARDARGRS